MMGEKITVHKLDAAGQEIFQYEGTLLARNAICIKLQAYFMRDDYAAPYHTFRRGDRFVEWFYTDRWYNIFEMYDVDDDHLKGWYCNITRPARFENGAIYAEDLALDLMVYPDGRILLLDEDEFTALELPPAERQQALNTTNELKMIINNAEGIFEKLKSYG